jgi:hypothetical protein
MKTKDSFMGEIANLNWGGSEKELKVSNLRHKPTRLEEVRYL